MNYIISGSFYPCIVPLPIVYRPSAFMSKQLKENVIWCIKKFQTMAH